MLNTIAHKIKLKRGHAYYSGNIGHYLSTAESASPLSRRRGDSVASQGDEESVLAILSKISTILDIWISFSSS